MRTDISQALAGLNRIPDLVRRAAIRALQEQAGPAAQRLREDAPHGDVTGATRASYSAYVVAREVDPSPAIRRGLAEAAARNPGYEQTYRGAPVGEDVVLVYTAFTSYFVDLVNRNAGEVDALTPDMIGISPGYTAAIADEIRDQLNQG